MHTWTISIQMQFLVFASLLFHFVLLPLRSCWILVLLFLTSASLLLQQVYDSSLINGLVFSHFWKFAAGILVYFALAETHSFTNIPEEENLNQSNNYESLLNALDVDYLNEDEKRKNGLKEEEDNDDNELVYMEAGKKQKFASERAALKSANKPEMRRFAFIFTYLILIALTVLMLIPAKNVNAIFSFLVVGLTSALLFISGSRGEDPPLLRHRIFSEIGEASMIWYLIQWPLILFYRHFFKEFLINVAGNVL